MKSTQSHKFSRTMRAALDVIEQMTTKQKKDYAKTITLETLAKARKEAGFE